MPLGPAMEPRGAPSSTSTPAAPSHVYSRPGRELLALPGLGWLRTLRWPVQSAILDGELFSGGGSDGIDAVLAARQRGGSDTAVAVFDLLQLDGQDVMAEPWVDRRKRLEDVFAAGITERLQLVLASEDAAHLWRVWVVEWGGEGIALKDRRSAYEPGTRSRCWWKAKNKLVLPVEVLQCGGELVRWGDWGRAGVMAFEYRDPRTDELVTVEQTVRVGVGRSSEWAPRRGQAEILCWGLLRSGLLRHPELVAWR